MAWFDDPNGNAFNINTGNSSPFLQGANQQFQPANPGTATGGGGHVFDDNGSFGSNGGLQSMARTTFNARFGDPFAQQQQSPVQSPFDYQGYTSPNANQQPAGSGSKFWDAYMQGDPEALSFAQDYINGKAGYTNSTGFHPDPTPGAPGWYDPGSAASGNPLANYGPRWVLPNGQVIDANSRKMYDPYQQLNTDGDFSKGPITLYGRTVSPGQGGSSSQYAGQGGGDLNQPRPAWWNKDEGGAPGTPDFVRNPAGQSGQFTPEEQQKRWEQRYYYLAAHPEDYNQQAPINAWYQQRDPQANAALQAVASGQAQYPGMSQQQAQAQLRMWDAMNNGGGIEPGQRIHTADGRIINALTGQQIGVDYGSPAYRATLPAPRTYSTGYSAPKAAAPQTAGQFGAAAANALLKPLAAPQGYTPPGAGYYNAYNQAIAQGLTPPSPQVYNAEYPGLAGMTRETTPQYWNAYNQYARTLPGAKPLPTKAK